MVRCIDGWVSGLMDWWVGGLMDGWMGRRSNEWIDGKWMDGLPYHGQKSLSCKCRVFALKSEYQMNGLY